MNPPEVVGFVVGLKVGGLYTPANRADRPVVKG